jgi:hypothetical protein
VTWREQVRHKFSQHSMLVSSTTGCCARQTSVVRVPVLQRQSHSASRASPLARASGGRQWRQHSAALTTRSSHASGRSQLPTTMAASSASSGDASPSGGHARRLLHP